MTEWPFGDLIPGSYDVIVADPPWPFQLYSAKGQKKSAASHYDTMSIADIKALPVDRLAQRDCLLLLWTTGWAMATGLAAEVTRAWNFVPVTEMVWNKKTLTGKPRMGTGYWARSLHEPILLAKMGKPMKFTAFPSAFNGIAREHSRKPLEFYSLVDKCARAARCVDLFSREVRVGWHSWGNEKTKFNVGSMRDASARPEREDVA